MSIGGVPDLLCKRAVEAEIAVSVARVEQVQREDVRVVGGLQRVKCLTEGTVGVAHVPHQAGAAPERVCVEDLRLGADQAGEAGPRDRRKQRTTFAAGSGGATI